MTNLYGQRKYRDFVKVDKDAMRAYYGLLLLAGVYRSHGECLTELWDDTDGRPIFRATMSLKRFKEINRCLGFDDKEERLQIRAHDKLAPIRNVFDLWINRSKALHVPGESITVDEQLIPFCGRTPFTCIV